MVTMMSKVLFLVAFATLSIAAEDKWSWSTANKDKKDTEDRLGRRFERLEDLE